MDNTTPPRPWQLPLAKEHGAWVMLATALAVGVLERPAGHRSGALVLVLAAVAAFLAREPAAVALGHRTQRRKKAEGPLAAAQAAGLAVVAAALGTWALLPLRTDTLIVLALLTPVGVLASAAVVRGKEHTLVAEVAAAVALALGGLLVQLSAASQGLAVAWPPYVAWGANFVALTLAVHLTKLRLLRAWSPWRVGLALVALEASLVVAVAAIVVQAGGLAMVRAAVLAPWLVALAGPGLCALAQRPRHLKLVGLAAAALYGVALLLAYAVN